MISLECLPFVLPQRIQEPGLVDDLAAMEWQKRIGTLEAEDADQYISRIDAAISRSVDSGKSLETMDSDGRTPLHWASANGHNQIVSTLLNRGADVNAACKFVGQTPLYLASRWGREETVRTLLLHGADPNQKDRFGKSAFEGAIAGDNRRVTEILQDHVNRRLS